MFKISLSCRIGAVGTLSATGACLFNDIARQFCNDEKFPSISLNFSKKGTAKEEESIPER